MRVVIRFLLAFLLLTATCFGAGRIKGKVVDRETNAPLVIGNIFLPAASLGSMTVSRGDDASPTNWDDIIPPSKNFLPHIKEDGQWLA